MALDPIARRQALMEAIRRWGQEHHRPTAPVAAPRVQEHLHRVMNGLFQQQRQVVLDPSRRLAMFTTRRAGKTSVLTPLAVQDAMACRDNEATIFVIGPTLEHAKALMWRPLENLNNKYDLGLRLREDPARCVFPTGVTLYFRGARDRDQLGVLRGFKTLNCFVDEIQDIRDDLIKEILAAIGPSLRDLNGRMIFSGTPGRLPIGEWYEITNGNRPNWSVHSWSLLENPFLPPEAKDIELILLEEGLTTDCPRFRNEYLGLWVDDTDDMVYAFDVGRNGVVGEVELAVELTWHYVMGMDFGTNDASTCMIGAFSYDSDEYYEVAESGASNLTISEFMKDHVLPLIEKYSPMRIVGDPQAKQLIAEINQRWGVNVQKADKQGKLAFIDIMNSDFMLGRIHTPVHFKVTKERQQLVWDPAAKPRLEEHPRRPNNFCDAALYAYREAKHWIGKTVKEAIVFESESHRQAYYLKQYIMNGANRSHANLSDWANDHDFY